jgi:hypothetical protein
VVEPDRDGRSPGGVEQRFGDLVGGGRDGLQDGEADGGLRGGGEGVGDRLRRLVAECGGRRELGADAGGVGKEEHDVTMTSL